MAKKLCSIVVRGNKKLWSFHVYADTKYIHDWVADGIVIAEVENVIPDWIVSAGFVKQWIWLQDLWHFKNPFRK